MEFKLKLDPLYNPISCTGAKSKCETCRIGPNGSGYCPGCHGHCGSKGPSQMATCHRGCMTCGGGEAAPNTVPAICCKSPLADIALTAVERTSYNWTKRPLIDLRQRGIVVTQGSVGGRIKDPYPATTEAVAVNLRHVWSRNGWYSKDMRDYLRIPSKTKLILLTMTHDDVLERAWDEQLHEEDWGAVGFDYWQPLTFSFYHTDAKMNMYWQWRRTLLATEASKAWFAPFTPWLMTRKADAVTRECVKSVPQVMFNAQFLSGDGSLESYLRMLVRQHNEIPKEASFWFVGVSTRKVVRMFKSFLRGRQAYFLSTTPWLSGHKGMEFVVTGQTKKSTLPKDQLVLTNQQSYMDMVAGA